MGVDRRKYVVIYSNHARAQLPTNGNAETTFDHAFQVIESCCDDAKGVARTLWVVDFSGFSLKHICKRHISLGCAWFGAHNPERLGALVLMNPPRIFMALWSFIHMFLDPDSAQRLVVFRSSAEAQVCVRARVRRGRAALLGCRWFTIQKPHGLKLSRTLYFSLSLFHQCVCLRLCTHNFGILFLHRPIWRTCALQRPPSG